VFGNIGKLSQLINELQERTRTMTVTVEAGGGAIKLVMNGHQEVVEMFLDQSLLHPANQSGLTGLTVEVYNEALRQSRQMVKEEVNKVTGGINLPFIPGLF